MTWLPVHGDTAGLPRVHLHILVGCTHACHDELSVPETAYLQEVGLPEQFEQ